MLTQVITAIKDITGFRFYFLTVLIFIGFLLITFKDNLKQLTFSPSELQEVSNEPGLLASLDAIKRDDPLITGYVSFLYQPKYDSYYKSLIVTDRDFIKQNEHFKAIPLNSQKYLNYRLVNKEYVLLEYTEADAVEYTYMYNSDYMLIYNVYVKETVAEVILTFDVKPTNEQIAVLLKKLRPLKFFII